MEFWEFLIQKEGDRSWLPLESPSAEILEGRYRIVARSNRASMPTEIRVTHYATTEDPPVQRVRKRFGQTNPDGLIVIMPFTRLQPGIWDLRCTGDLMAEMLGETWQHRIQLEVLPQEASLADDWEPEWTGPESPAVPIAESTVTESEPIAAVESEIHVASPTMPEVPSLPDQPIVAEMAGAVAETTEFHLPETTTPEETAQPSDSTELILDRSTTPTDAVPNSISALWQQIEQVSQQVVDSAFSDLNEFAVGTSVAEQPELRLAPEAPSQTAMRVVLEQETFVIQRGEPLLLTGRLESPADLLPGQQPNISELRVRLYDPQTSQVLMDEVHPIANCKPPFPFSGKISLPEHYQTYLVLGELLFQGSYGTETPQVLVRRSFNVTTDLHELIESIANDFPDIEALPPEARLPETTEPVSAADLDRLSAQAPALFRRSAPSTLPPQLRPPDPTRTHASLDLPSFGFQSLSEPALNFGEPDLKLLESPLIEPQPQPEAEMLKMDLEDDKISTSAADLQLEQPGKLARESVQQSLPERLRKSLRLSASPQDSAQAAPDAELPDDFDDLRIEAIDPPTAPVKPSSEGRLPATKSSDLISELGEDPADLFADWETMGHQVPLWQRPQARPANQSNAPEDVSFRALNLQNRFWTRLQSLASNSAAPADSTGSGLSSHVGTGSNSETGIQHRSASGLDAELTAGEIVVEDDVLPVLLGVDAAQAPEPVNPELLGPTLPADEPIPTPRLQLPSGELLAGQPIALSIKLPTLEARVYVKLWLRDRQTRTLLGPPRWLIDFVPDGFGNQMARTEVIVPPGCLKVQFEAIAVEIATQRESDKAALTRLVVPPDISPLSLDGLEI